MKTIVEILKERNLIPEGIEDPGILKAIFTAGGPGSGKSKIAAELFNIPSKSTLSSFGLKMVNSDVPFEKMLAKHGLSANLSNIPPELRQKIMGDDPGSLRSRAKRVYDSQLALYKNERLGLIVDGTGHDVEKIKKIKDELESIGYDCFMVFVNTDLDVAQSRNSNRNRKLPPDVVEERWSKSQRNIGHFQSIFGADKFVVVDNSENTKEKITSGSEMFGNVEQKAKIEIDKSVVKTVAKFIRAPIRNPIGKEWIRQEELNSNITSDFHKTFHSRKR